MSANLFHVPAIRYDNANGKPSLTIADQTMPLSPDRDGISTLNLWMDGSVIETFFDNKAAMTARCYRALFRRFTSCIDRGDQRTEESHRLWRNTHLRRPF